MAEAAKTGAGRSPYVLGICGAPGSGKSAFARELGQLGAAIIDADALAHQTLDRDEVKEIIKDEWGRDVFSKDGKIDRAALGRIVFENEEDRKKLEKIVHPRVRASMMREMAAAKDRGAKMIVLDVPLLLEAGLGKWCHAAAFVDAAREKRLARLAERHGWNDEQAAQREKAQMPPEEKKQMSDFTIDNNGSLDELRRQAETLFNRIAGNTPHAENTHEKHPEDN